MKSNAKRLIFAACLSLTCAFATFAWYRMTEYSTQQSNETPLAQVARVGDEVLRRPPTRLLWQSVTTGDNLYNGETIRTSSLGELRIQFEDGKYIDLEPDSLIVLQQNKGEINLDLMEGSAFVHAQVDQKGKSDTKSAGLTLSSKGNKVDLTGASASISKGKDDRIDMQVLEGQAKIRSASGQETSVGSGQSSTVQDGQLKQTQLQILSPLANKVIFIDVQNKQPITFSWSGLPQNTTVEIWAGKNKKEMKMISTIAEKNEIQAPLSLGRHWWKLIAKETLTSKIIAETSPSRFEVAGKYLPTVLSPTPAQEISTVGTTAEVLLKWQKPDDKTRVQIEISADPRMRNHVLNQSFTTEEQHLIPSLPVGEYYLRLSSRYPETEKPLIGQIQKFTVSKKAPTQKDPVQIDLQPTSAEQVFVKEPKLQLKWLAQNRKDEIAKYKVKIQNTEVGAEPILVDSQKNELIAPVPRAGRYIASIQAFDQKGQMIGESASINLAAQELPRLKATDFIPAQEKLSATKDGTTELQWAELPGAQSYSVYIYDQQGQALDKKVSATTSLVLKSLMPGEYKLKIEGQDEHGRMGQASEFRTLIVPEKSNVRAPTLKRIKVE